MVHSDLKTVIGAALSKDGATSSDFDLNPSVFLPEGRKLRPAGVLVPIMVADIEPAVILTKRSAQLRHHPGQIAFPGGKQDEGDANVIEAALREAKEEIGLPSDRCDVLGTLPTHETVTGFQVTPVVAMISGPFEAVAEAGEVDEIFSVPLAHFADSRRFRVESRSWRGQRRHYYVVPFGPYYIWGATARILRGLADRLSA